MQVCVTLTGATIRLVDFSKPLRRRVEMRKVCGPYMLTVRPANARRDGFGFYFGSDGGMARHGGRAGLRVAAQTPHGYYADDYRDSVIYGYALALPHGRGYLAAIGEGANMWGSVDYEIHATERDALYAADSMAERAAEREREYRAQEEEEADPAE